MENKEYIHNETTLNSIKEKVAEGTELLNNKREELVNIIQ